MIGRKVIFIGETRDSEAIFHGFSTRYISNGYGYGQQPVAIIEMSNGTIEIVDLDQIRFAEPYNPKIQLKDGFIPAERLREIEKME